MDFLKGKADIAVIGTRTIREVGEKGLKLQTGPRVV